MASASLFQPSSPPWELRLPPSLMTSSKARGGPPGRAERFSMDGIRVSRVVAKVDVGRWEERES